MYSFYVYFNSHILTSHIYFIVLYICLGSNFVTNCTTFDQIKDECSVENEDCLIHNEILLIHFSKELYPFTVLKLYFMSFMMTLLLTKKFLVLFCTFILSYKTDY